IRLCSFPTRRSSDLTDYIAGVAYQPVFGSGRANPIDPMRRMTTTGVLKRLGPQTNGRADASDFIALPCSHPDCCAITYFVKEDRSEEHTSELQTQVE